ncbi:MAG: HAD hydrolase-like protein [Prevotella sp.]|nr:HAD hydrolase-like protein [Prevotella sp.]
MTQIQEYLKQHGYEHFAPKAVLFDMDGVLYNSMPNHAVAWQRSMAEFGIHMTANDAYATEGARGIDTIRNMVRAQRGQDITLEEAQRMYDIKTRLFHEMPEAPVFDGVIALMKQIKEAGMKIGVVTGSGQRPLIQRLMTDFGDFLDESHIVTAYDVTKGKPAPDPYLMGLQKVGNLQPWEGIVVENAPLGVRAGVAAGCLTIAVNSGPLPDRILAQEGAHLIYNNMVELADDFHHFLSRNNQNQEK